MNAAAATTAAAARTAAVTSMVFSPFVRFLFDMDYRMMMNAAVARTAAAATQAAINMAFSPFFYSGFLVPVDMHTIAHPAGKMCRMSFLTCDL